MPLPFFVSSSDNFTGGMAYTRFKGVTLSGTIGSTNPGPIEATGGFAVIQPALVVSSLGQKAQVLSTAMASIAAANYIYIPQTTGSLLGSTSTGFAPPLTGMGAALLWDAGSQSLGVFSTVAMTWLFSRNLNTTSTSALFTSSA